MSFELKLTLIENSYSFLRHSLSQAILAEETPENWKYALLHLVQAIELALKELLRQEHPTLIFRDIDKQKETVSLSFAARRLQKISNIAFKKEDLDAIALASHHRNQIVHYEFSFKVEEVKLIYAKLIGFLQSFLMKHLKISLDEIVETNIWQEALNIIEYAKELAKRANERIKEEGIDEILIMECRRCYNYTFVFQDEIDTCYACGYMDDIYQCDKCKEYFYSDEVEALNEFDDQYYCDECKQLFIDDYPGYWDDVDYLNNSPY